MNAPLLETLEPRRLLSADLAGSFVGRLPPTLTPGGPKSQVSVRLTNVGDAPAAGNASVHLYASTDLALDGSDALLAGVTRRIKLKTGKAINLILKVSGSVSVSEGSYYLLAKVDSAGIGDSKADNNVIASPAPVQIAEPVVDLAAQITELPLQPVQQSGPTQQAVVRITNLGNVPARGKVAVSWFLSTDTTLDANDILIAAPAPAQVKIAPGKSVTFATPVALPANTPAGSYNVLARVNAGGGINDANAANNVAVGSAPVLVVTISRPVETPTHTRIYVVEREIGYVAVGTGVAAVWVDDTGQEYDGSQTYDNTGDYSSTADPGASDSGPSASDGSVSMSPPDLAPPSDAPPTDEPAPPPEPPPAPPSDLPPTTQPTDGTTGSQETTYPSTGGEF